MKLKNSTRGVLYALIANVIFGFSFLFSKTALTVAHPLVILSVRFTVAFLFLNILWLCGAIKICFRGKNCKKLVFMALAQPLLYFLFELYGISMVSSALAGVVISLVPVAVLFYSAAFSAEKPNGRQILFSVVSLVAVGALSVLQGDGKPNHALGVILLFLAVASAAAFNLLSRSEAKTFSPVERTYGMFFVGAIGFHLVGVISLRENYLPEIRRALSSPTFDFAMIYLALISSVLAFLLYNASTTHLPAVRAASFSNLITVVSLFAGIVILKEDFTLLQILLCVPIIAGVYGVNRAAEP